MDDEQDSTSRPHTNREVSAIGDPSARTRAAALPWTRVVLILGVVLIVSGAAVTGIALRPWETPAPATIESTTVEPASSPVPSPSLVAAAPDDRDLTPAELASRFGSAVWQVYTDGCGFEAAGTAFAIGPRTLITNAHVVENDAAPTIVSRDGTTRVATVVAGADHELDVAVLATDTDLPGRMLSWASADELAEGQPVVALGYPVPDHSFTVTPATVMSFQTEGRIRQALRLDGLVDKGNSGGPALTATGEVAGVVTGLLGSGYQWIAVAYTHDYLADAIRRINRDRPGLEVDCAAQVGPPTVPEGWDWEDEFDWDVSGPDRYGDDPALDRLYDECTAGDMFACDELYWGSPYGSEYENFAMTCGGTEPEPVWGDCSWTGGWDEDDWFDDADEPMEYGDDSYLDDLWDRCAAGDLSACDDLYYESPIGSEYESFGAECGGNVAEPWSGMCTWDE